MITLFKINLKSDFPILIPSHYENCNLTNFMMTLLIITSICFMISILVYCHCQSSFALFDDQQSSQKHLIPLHSDPQIPEEMQSATYLSHAFRSLRASDMAAEVSAGWPYEISV